jgi:hypothetical protein
MFKKSAIARVAESLSKVETLHDDEIADLHAIRIETDRLFRTLTCGECRYLVSGGYCQRRQIAGRVPSGPSCDLIECRD